MEQQIGIEAFLKTIRQKRRDLVYTNHSLNQAKKRSLVGNGENTIKIFETDILERIPDIVVEQNSERQGERKFKTYYKSDALGGFLCYVISVDGKLTLITIYRTSKNLQKRIYNCRTRGF